MSSMLKTFMKMNRFYENMYDAENRLVRLVAAEPGDETKYGALFGYDPSGRRAYRGVLRNPEESDEWETLFFSYDGDDVIAEFALEAETAPGYGGSWTKLLPKDDAGGGEISAALNAHYLHGPGVDEQLVWWSRDFTVSNWRGRHLEPRLYFKDGLGSVRAIAGAAGTAGESVQAIVGTYTYDSFGNEIETCGRPALLNRYRYTGREFDYFGKSYETTLYTTSTSLYYFRNRNYDQRLGTFLQTDPAWSLNLYPYVSNNPVMMYDPYGDLHPGIYIVGGVVGVGAAGWYLYGKWRHSQNPTVQWCKRMITEFPEIGIIFDAMSKVETVSKLPEYRIAFLISTKEYLNVVHKEKGVGEDVPGWEKAYWELVDAGGNLSGMGEQGDIGTMLKAREMGNKFLELSSQKREEIIERMEEMIRDEQGK